MEGGGGACGAGEWGTNTQSEPSRRLQSAIRFSESFVLDEVGAIRRRPADLPSGLYTTGLTGAGGDNAAEPAPPQHVAGITGEQRATPAGHKGSGTPLMAPSRTHTHTVAFGLQIALASWLGWGSHNMPLNAIPSPFCVPPRLPKCTT